jgi:formylglycine-generating enzyme required for sulfatase activity/predicted Ser/Thr protein kinase
MSGFIQALHSYRNGALSREEILDELERQLASGEADAGTLLAALNNEQARERLPGNIHIELVRRLLRRRDSVGLAQAQASPAAGAAADDDAATVFIEQAQGSPQRRFAPLPPQRRKAGISVGSVLKGRFRLIEPIGEGGMSTVYKAIDLRKVEARAPETHVAVKLLTVPMSDFTRSLELLQAEANKLQRLPHPNIVRVIDCDRDGRTVFMTMEHLSGESLKRKMAAADFKGIPLKDALPIIGSIASALTFAHRNGIVHGDLKPGNVIITEQGEVKIIDFGIARLMTRDPGATVAGDERPKLSALTPPYASPEMLENGAPDPRDDVYGLACIAHELITGRHPFDRRVANDARDSGMKLIRHPPLAPAQFKAIARGLDFDRARRTPAAGQFFEELSARPGMRPDTLAALAGAIVIVGLIIAYFLDNGRIVRWIESHRDVSIVAPAQGEVFRDCPTCPLMKALPAGHFQQGAADDAPDSTPFERPRHPVAIGYPLGMSVYEITVGEFKEFAAATSHRSAGCETYNGTWQASPELNWDNVGYTQSATHPVACVSWRDARDYAAWLSAKTGQKYRLPSESEWEYAARAGSDLSRPWSADPGTACASANVADRTAAQHFPGWKVHPCTDGYVYTAPVGSFKPNGFGLYDMLGNVFEWVADCWHEDYQGAPGDGSAWPGGDCSQRAMRGGSWFTAPALVGTSARNRFEDTYRSNSVGFRLVREIKQ